MIIYENSIYIFLQSTIFISETKCSDVFKSHEQTFLAAFSSGVDNCRTFCKPVLSISPHLIVLFALLRLLIF